MFALFLFGCLERVTGEPVPLDERFYKSAESRHGDPNKGDGTSDPFASMDGEKITVSGIVSCETMGSIDLDFRTPDPSIEGGMKGQGKLLLDRPGVFTLQVPKNTGSVEVQAFQDVLGDGPSFDDPFAQITFEVQTEDILDLEIQLVEGARNDDPNPAPPPNGPQHEQQEHTEHPHENREHQDHPNGGNAALISGLIDYLEAMEFEKVTWGSNVAGNNSGSLCWYVNIAPSWDWNNNYADVNTLQ